MTMVTQQIEAKWLSWQAAETYCGLSRKTF